MCARARLVDGKYISNYYTKSEADDRFVNVAGDTMTGNLSFSNGGTEFRGINYGTMGDNDQWRIGGAATGSNSGYMEIATADDGTEPIYVRQYTGVFSSLARTLTLLDGSGNTIIPGNVGIGTTSPRSKLDVYGTEAAVIIGKTNSTPGVSSARKLRLGLATAGHFGSQYWAFCIDDTTSSSYMQIGYSKDDIGISISHDGYLGIGNNYPSYKLHVEGDIYTTTGFKKKDSSDSYVLLGGGGHKAISDFAAASHTHNYIVSLGNKSASTQSSSFPYPGMSCFSIYNNGYPFDYGCGITIYNGGAFQIAGQWNAAVSSLTDYDYPTEMYIRGRRDSFDVWTTWTRVLTNRNYTSFTVKKDGTGASGTWGINISGNAAYASSAGNADTVDSQHFNWNNNKNDHTYLWAASSNGQAYLVHRASMSVNYANYTGYLTAYTSSTNGTGADMCYLWYDWANTYSLGNYFHGIWVGAPDGNIGYDLAYLHGDKAHLYMRSYDYGSWNSWYKICTNADTYVSSGIGVINGNTITNVSYSSSSGCVGSGYTYNLNEPSTWSSDGARLILDQYNLPASNQPASVDNANSLVTFFKTKHGTSGQYASQLAFPDHNRFYFRYAAAGSWSAWYTVAFTSDIPSSLPANGGNADSVTIHYDDNSNSTYQMLWGSGNYVYGTGGIYCNPYSDCIYASHYYETSDIRLKTDFKNLNVSINSIASLPVFDFSWKDKIKNRNTGTSAQAVQAIFPNIVTESNNTLKLDYGVLGTASSIIIAREVLRLKEEIRQLKQKLGIIE